MLVLILFTVAAVVALPLSIMAVRYLRSAIQTVRRTQNRPALPVRPSRSPSAPAEELLASPAALRGSGRIHLVPVGEVASVSLPGLANHFRQRFGLAVQLMPMVPLPLAAEDSKRKQVVAEELITRMKLAYPTLADDPDALLIGITERDMYIWHYDWNYALNLRLDRRFAVLSTARLDPTFDEQPADPAQLESRVRKMLTKNIGLLYYGLSQNNDPHSVLYGGIDIGEDLDEMRDGFTEREILRPEGSGSAAPESGAGLGHGRLLWQGSGVPCWNLVHASPAARQVSGWQWMDDCNSITPQSATAEAYSVDLRYGIFFVRRADFLLSATRVFGTRMTRVCRNQATGQHAFGLGCNHSFGVYLWSGNPLRELKLVLEDSSVSYHRTTPPLFFWPTVYEQTGQGGNYQGSRIEEKFPWRGWVLSLTDGTQYEFTNTGYLQSMHDDIGNRVLLKRTGEREEHLTHIQTLPETHGILFDLDAAGRILRATSDSSGTASYKYDERGRLTRVAASGWLLDYGYDDHGNLLSVTEAERHPVVSMEYDAKGRATRQLLPDGRHYEFRYIDNAAGQLVRTDIVDKSGHVISAFFDGDLYRVVAVR